MRPRDASEPHRTATTLELFFDLVFVIAVASAASELHHALSAGHPEGILTFAMVFFAIWWPWMNFTWFATSFGTDDWLYRVLTFVQMGGVLIVAAAIPRIFADNDFILTIIGYVVMRLALVAQWLRASRNAGEARGTALRYAFGVTAVQLLWIGSLLVPADFQMPVFLFLILAELSVPMLSEARRPLPWHPHHIAERYGLFTIIVLGEGLLGASNAIIEASERDRAAASALVDRVPHAGRDGGAVVDLLLGAASPRDLHLPQCLPLRLRTLFHSRRRCRIRRGSRGRD